ncbi:FeoA family protein [Algoriphagus sediminis]|uniref:FeoA family protein n=1 Tax=Algoriphagus sediminis TaxID=3057113 RepID=A0ABT7YAC2_9BACT|nr:FeoA family protein [Algoriphagus sediminis]MDN3203381.1 FeoA family protein [Algoriphagus sediminis]
MPDQIGNMSLSADQLKLAEYGLIIEISDSPLKINLLEMGFLPGKKIMLSHAAPANGPLAFQIDGSTLALRKSEAALIQIESTQS